LPIEKINIERFLELARLLPVIDVRSPGEYNHAHIPGAHSLPLFNNEERAAVGTAYKQESREKAIKIGLDFFGPKMKKMVEEVESIVGSRESRSVLIYCWRGGMRSAAVAWLMDLYGFKVYTLTGGYKTFRNYTLASFSFPLSLSLLGGYTGSGKTEVLKELTKGGHTAIDLEDLAKHKGSAFGNIGMPDQPSQEMFENLLAIKLRENISNTIWLEDESQRIGHVNIPGDLWDNMRRSPIYFLDIPFEERLDHVTEEYGNLDRQRMCDAIDRISRRLGGLEAKNATTLLSEGKTRDAFRILLTYYDRWYLKSLHNREGVNSLLYKVTCDTVNPLNAKKLWPEYYEKL
jgi:tRNA 2-selenouridine synthase